jgi:DNA-binding NarL/FixJ family response regulator
MTVRVVLADDEALIRAGFRLVLRPEHDSRILILTTFGEDHDVYAALRAGASGFLLKDSTPEDLVHAIRVVARGEALLGPATTRQVVAAWVRRAPAAHAETPGAARLGQRERAVVEPVAAGATNAEIAAELRVTESTVKTHLARAQHKLGLRDRVHVVIWAYDTGLAGAPASIPRTP